MIGGIDISSWQENIDWSLVPTESVKFVFAKATEGTDFYSNQFQRQHDGAKSRNIPFGAYHYLDPAADGKTQAEYFLEAIDGYEGQLLPAVDIEEASGQTADQIITCIEDFTAAVDATLAKKRTIVYTYLSFWQNTMGGSSDFSGHPLWIAQYPVRYKAGTKPKIPKGWSSAVLWQYADTGDVPGITGITTSPDMDLLLGNDIRIIFR